MARYTSSLANRAAKKRAKQLLARPRSLSPQHSTKAKPLISLQSFISNFFYLVAIQDDDEIFEETYEKTEAPKIVEVGNGEDLSRESFKDFIAELRATVIDRQLVDQSFVVVPEDPEGKAGSVAHIVEMSGIQQGKHVTIKIVAVLKIIFEQRKSSRLIKMESFVLETDED